MFLQDRELTIRNAEPEDAPLLGGWWRDGKVMEHAGFPLGLDVTDEEIAASLLKDSDRTRRRLIIEEDGTPIGEMSYSDAGDASAEIGIKICDFSRQNRGCGTRLLRMLIGGLFDMGFERIILDTNLRNTRAQHVYEKLGFRKKGVRADAWTDQLGRPQSAVDYELTKSDCRWTE